MSAFTKRFGDMTNKAVFLGSSPLNTQSKAVSGAYVERNGEVFYKIENFSDMSDFFISVVSDSNHWLFISTRGGLTAGRTDCDSALFPYYTEDKIRDHSDHTGSRTLALVDMGNKCVLWEPFSAFHAGVYTLQRNLYKNVLGDKLVFEETNIDLGLRFSYTWATSDRYGFVKQSSLENIGDHDRHVELLDGIENLLPYGVLAGTQNELSCLVDAYKKNERVADSVLAIYCMSSILSDRAEPSEALSATTVWSYGATHPQVLLSSLQLDNFRRGESISAESEILGRRGAYFIHQNLALAVGEIADWGIVADVNQGPAAVSNTLNNLQTNSNLAAEVKADIERGSENLRRLIGTSDGLQVTGDTLTANHHAANVLFNIMRGGLFEDNYAIDKHDLQAFCQDWNAPVTTASAAFFETLPNALTYHTLNDALEQAHNPQLERLCREYLPLSFSRRHGDPSRPWNRFAIKVKDDKGARILNYEGNWRDIFQNWEALGTSIPCFSANMITKFVNASTADGYNPYRITRQGIDWERPEPENPWANIGYWGDHQLIYLLKLIEQSVAHNPSAMNTLLTRDVFAYANVPYRLKPYADILADPYNTIEFDEKLDAIIDERVADIGADGRLLMTPEGNVYQVNLTEKILVTLLTKLANFIPDAGIWMNTQRPEWNDANNALVGNGVSVVTLCYLHRFLKRAISLFTGLGVETINVSVEVKTLFDNVFAVLNEHGNALTAGPVSDHIRKDVMDGLGAAAENYRNGVYARGFSGARADIRPSVLLETLQHALAVSAVSIRANRRDDGLYHAYNRIAVRGDGVEIRYLYEMLEGQVAVLSADVLSPEESLVVLRSLRESELYTARQHSYLLYPNRKLPAFIERSRIPSAFIEASPLLQSLKAIGDTQLIECDAAGNAYFNGRFNNTVAVGNALDRLTRQGYDAAANEREAIENLFATLFDCANFTGRSGGMYAYEGLGSIYWHMVSKLLLAVMETTQRAEVAGCDADTLTGLHNAYYDVRAGIGFNKSPDIYGAFPTDPYSHTPGFAGARQPGMTGQVKEEVLTRLAELGVVVEGACVSFKPSMLRAREFLTADSELVYFDVNGNAQSVVLQPQQLGFTYCQVPVIYTQTGGGDATVTWHDGKQIQFASGALDAATSASLFMKLGEIARIDVSVNTVLTP